MKSERAMDVSGWSRPVALAFGQAVAILLAAGLAGVLTYRWHPRSPAFFMAGEEPGPAEVTAHQAREWEAREILWVDARAEADFRAAHVPGAIRLSPDNWDADLLEVFHRLQQAGRIVIYEEGPGGKGARDVAERLRRIGISQAYVLRGDWREFEPAIRAE
ncbi:MAG TPA: rhodanese-like domain-containing protein [Verrucomicrobiales bacterium]|nr:rhodanese-like domain-containing protein [Verrucomicrobiales bacterium]